MPLIYVVRHGRADVSPPLQSDPPLDAQGLHEAEAVAARLAALLPRPLPILSSPLRRCRQTAAPLADRWGVEIRIDERLRELPTPPPLAAERRRWLAQMVRLRWSELAEHCEALSPGYAAQLARWRADAHAALRDCRQDSVAFSHFVVINALASGESGDGPVSLIEPGNGSVSVFETSADGLRLRSTESATDLRLS